MEKNTIKKEDIIDLNQTKINQDKFFKILNACAFLNTITFKIFEKKFVKIIDDKKNLIVPVLK